MCMLSLFLKRLLTLVGCVARVVTSVKRWRHLAQNDRAFVSKRFARAWTETQLLGRFGAYVRGNRVRVSLWARAVQFCIAAPRTA